MTALVPLKRVAAIRVSNVDKKSAAGEERVRLCNYTDVYYRPIIRNAQRFMAATASPEQIRTFRLKRGDVIITKDSETAEDIGVPAFVADASPDLVCGYHLALIRPSLALDGRYLYWSLASTAAQEQFALAATGVTRYGLRTDSIGALMIRVPESAEQRAIADLLDTETARIDSLIAKKRKMVKLLHEQVWAAFVAVVAATDAPRAPLRRALSSVTDGPFGSAFSSSDYSDDGLAVVRLGNIGFAEWRATGLAHLPVRRFEEFRRYHVREGNVLFAGLGDVNNHAGRACVAPNLGPAIVKGKCFCGVVNLSVALPQYLAAFCSSPVGGDAIAVEARGSTRSMINLDIIKSVNVPLPSVETQRAIVDRFESARARVRSTQQRLETQVARLEERRAALITGAVTGHLSLQGAPKRGAVGVAASRSQG